jgi:hypothetical protein
LEVVTLLFGKALDHVLLSPIGNCTKLQRLSIFTDDLVLFVKPKLGNLVRKSMIGYAYPTFCVVSQGFPIKYLGMQLALCPLTRAQWQLLLDLAMRTIPSWQGGLISRPGRQTLV